VAGRSDIPVYSGRASEARPIGEQHAWARGFRSRALKSGDAVAFMKREIERAPGEVTLIAVGPLTNLGDLFTRHPEVKPKIKEVVIMGGAVYVGYNNEPPPMLEWNLRCDPAAARTVYTAGVPLTMAGLEATTMLKLDAPLQKRLFAQGSPVTDALAALTNLWGHGVPTLFDPMAVAWALGHRFCEPEFRHVIVEDDGLTRLADGPPNATVLTQPRKEAFLDWYIATLAR
jgi:inosine-uridine nucleoside N-ribohydrolase